MLSAEILLEWIAFSESACYNYPGTLIRLCRLPGERACALRGKRRKQDGRARCFSDKAGQR